MADSCKDGEKKSLFQRLRKWRIIQISLAVVERFLVAVEYAVAPLKSKCLVLSGGED